MHTSRLREFMAKNYGLLSKFVIRTLVVMPQINVSDPLHISTGLGNEDISNSPTVCRELDGADTGCPISNDGKVLDW